VDNNLRDVLCAMDVWAGGTLNSLIERKAQLLLDCYDGALTPNFYAGVMGWRVPDWPLRRISRAFLVFFLACFDWRRGCRTRLRNCWADVFMANRDSMGEVNWPPSDRPRGRFLPAMRHHTPTTPLGGVHVLLPVYNLQFKMIQSIELTSYRVWS
jgi:hypothetical protein